MRKLNFTKEYAHLVSLLDLRPGELALDTQTEPDALLPLLSQAVTSRGRAVGMASARNNTPELTQALERMGMDYPEVVSAHPVHMPFKPQLFHAVVLRQDTGMVPSLEHALNELHRVAKTGGRVVARRTEWQIQLPKATEQETRMIDALPSPSSQDGQDFFRRFATFKHRAWADIRFDVFTLATRDERHRTRYPYDWRTMVRQRLINDHRFTAREILDLIERLQSTRGAKVVIDRYLAVGIKA